MTETAIPILPSRDLSATTRFYGRLGFEVRFRQDEPDPYLIVHRGSLELHFFVLPDLDPWASNWMCYLRVGNADWRSTPSGRGSACRTPASRG